MQFASQLAFASAARSDAAEPRKEISVTKRIGFMLLFCRCQFGRNNFTLRRSAGRRRCRGLETAPAFERHRRDGHERELAGDESAKPRKFFIHETVRVQADAEHVDAPPGE